ncbi:MAG: dephospho-CoA kinase [Acidobacteriaceae bacterium]|nr:dephospho-CoA kinase [Acidobacteriaceae bacterium]
MLKVGLTGGYATGKTFVARELERLGCHLIYADKLGHQVLLPDGEAYRPVVDAFGPEILDPNGLIDRKKLAAIVFASPELLDKLSCFVHPAVIRLEQQMLEAIRNQDSHAIAVIEAAILIETERFKVFDRLIVTVCDPETQIARAMKRDHVTREQACARIGKQLPNEEKIRHAQYVIDTSASKEETLRQVRQIYRELEQLAANQIG